MWHIPAIVGRIEARSAAQGAEATKGTGKTVTNIIRLSGDEYRRFLTWQEIRARREGAERGERDTDEVVVVLPEAKRDDLNAGKKG